MKLQRIALPIIFLAGLATGVHAQARLGLLIRAGLFSPTDGDARALGKTWFTGGGEFSVGKLPFSGKGPNPPRLTFSIDAYSKAGASSLPIMVNMVQYTSKSFFWTAGVGGASVHRSGFKDSFELAYSVGAGYDYGSASSPITFQVRFFSVNDVGSLLDGFAFTVGVRM